jgi:ribosomal protein L40E
MFTNRRVLHPIFLKRILSASVNQTICTKCGASLIAGTSFCRQCGQPAIDSEQVTAILGQSPDASTTKRLDPRPTTPGYEVSSSSPASTSGSLTSSKNSWSKLLTIGIVLSLLVVICVGVIWSLRWGGRSASNTQINRSLIYPGSRTVVDVGDSGGAVLQLETPDALDKVRGWYEVNLKPTKTLRVTSTSVILKNDNVTATLVSENNTTSIVIKQVR